MTYTVQFVADYMVVTTTITLDGTPAFADIVAAADNNMEEQYGFSPAEFAYTINVTDENGMEYDEE